MSNQPRVGPTHAEIIEAWQSLPASSRGVERSSAPGAPSLLAVRNDGSDPLAQGAGVRGLTAPTYSLPAGRMAEGVSAPSSRRRPGVGDQLARCSVDGLSSVAPNAT